MTDAHPSDSRFVLVPREPSREMIQAGRPRLGDTASAVWSAMVSAAPGGEGEPVAWRPTHRHVGRGGEYQVIGTATVQTTEGLCDYDTVTLYRDSERLTWARHIDEFNDGRFVALTAPPPPEPVAWRPDRAEVARIIDPLAWGLHDDVSAEEAAFIGISTEPSLTKADRVLALTAPSPNDLGSSSLSEDTHRATESSVLASILQQIEIADDPGHHTLGLIKHMILSAGKTHPTGNAVADAVILGFLHGVGREPWSDMHDYIAVCATDYASGKDGALKHLSARSSACLGWLSQAAHPSDTQPGMEPGTGGMHPNPGDGCEAS